VSENQKTMKDINEEIRDILLRIDNRLDIKEVFSESDSLIKKAENRADYELNQIQSCLNRIHDKLFTLNTALIAAFFALGTFPNESPILKLWTSAFPVINLFFLLFVEYKQMEIHRFASGELQWTETERNLYRERIKTQTRLSLLSILFTIAIFVYLVVILFSRQY